MRYTQFPVPVDTRDGLTVEAGRLSSRQLWSGQPTDSKVPSGRRIDRLGSPYLRPRPFPNDTSSGAVSPQGITRRSPFFTTPLC
jgi:hypothetical protein